MSQEGGRFPCHRLFLATQSPVQYSDEVVKYFVDFFYTGSVSQKVLQENFDSFLALAEFYDVKPLKLQTEEAAIEKITVGNMIDMFALADRYNAENLKEVSECLIKTNRNVLKDQDLSGVPANVFTEVFRLLC